MEKGSYSSRPYSVAYPPKVSGFGCPCSLNEKLERSNGYANAAAYHGRYSEDSERTNGGPKDGQEEVEEVPTEGISRPMSEILKQVNKKVPDSLINVRSEDGFPLKYITWHIVNRIMNLHAPEWSGEVQSVIYSADGKSVSVVYCVTVRGTDSEIFRESTGTASVDDKSRSNGISPSVCATWTWASSLP